MKIVFVKVTLIGSLAFLAACGSGGTTTPGPGPGSKITVAGTVKNFDGSAASGVTVQIGDTGSANGVQAQTDAAGKFTAKDVTAPYTISVVSSLAQGTPVSFKDVSRTDPTLVLQGQNKICNRAEAYVRFRASAVVAAGNVGYMYYLAEGIHEDSLLSNAVTVLRPGQKGGIVRVVLGNGPCKSPVTGSLVYLERGPSGYVTTGKLDGVEASTGTALPSTPEPYVVNVNGSSSVAVSGQVSLPGGFEQGFVVPVLKVGKASVILSDPRDRDAVDKLSVAGSTYGLNLPPAINGVGYRVGAFAGGANHLGWAFSDLLATPLAAGGVTQAISIANTFQGQEPSGNIFDTVIPKLVWTPSSSANLYFSRVLNTGASTCGEMSWSGVALGSTNFTMPRLPPPARLDVGTSAAPCQYVWTPSNAITVRDEPLTSDKLLDGRLVLKRLYGEQIFNFLSIVPVQFSPTTTVDTSGSITTTQIVSREEFLAGGESVAQPLDIHDLTSTIDPQSDVSSYLIPAATRNTITLKFSSNNVGAFNNPDEVASGVININSQPFQTQPK
jgi:hypothetical protein